MVQGLGFRVQGSGFGFEGLRLGFWCLGFTIESQEFGI